MNVGPCYRDKLADLQGTLELYNRISRLQRPHNENWHVHYCMRARGMATNASISQGVCTRGLGMYFALPVG